MATSPAVKPLYAAPSDDYGRERTLAPFANSIFSAETWKSSCPLESTLAASANFAALSIISWLERWLTDTAKASFDLDVRAAWISWNPMVHDFPI